AAAGPARTAAGTATREEAAAAAGRIRALAAGVLASGAAGKRALAVAASLERSPAGPARGGSGTVRRRAQRRHGQQQRLARPGRPERAGHGCRRLPGGLRTARRAEAARLDRTGHERGGDPATGRSEERRVGNG